ncbi:MAG: HAD family acid phosphatase [Chloroflexota bacterium]|nr:HAD family acid phosphatase [Chloroflexota bacterium]
MVRKYYLLFSLILVSFLMLTACAQTEPTPTVIPQPLSYTVTPDTSKDSQPNQNTEITQNNQINQNLPETNNALAKLNSILWMQTSAEFRMTAIQSYALASVMLDRGLEDANWTAAVEQIGDYSNLPPAIIMDVDETVLDNSAYQARLVRAGTSWDINIWNEWVLESKAPAIPGVVEFLQYAQSKGVTVFYMTNRSHELEQATRENLIDLGCPMEDELDTLLTHGEQENWVTDKTNRRSLLAEQYRIILLIGDDPNDFVAGTKDGNPTSRNEVFSEYQAYWGEKWILIPNPIYGGWEAALYDFNYGLSAEEKFDLKLEWLDPVD